MLDPYQVFEARALGADCILLIMAASTTRWRPSWTGSRTSSGMDVLVEVHDARGAGARAASSTPT